MWPFDKTQTYQQVVDQEHDEIRDKRLKWQHGSWRVLLAILFVLLLFSVLVFGSWAFRDLHISVHKESVDGNNSVDEMKLESNTTNQSICQQRREWRSLTASEQQAYISAVLCLRDQPSTLSLSPNSTSYDDFPWVHSHVGYYTHNSAPFLPWHRYFLHIYESTLRRSCGYVGSLVYWDWTLDSDQLEHSPIFDSKSGFGGDGELDGTITVGRSGRCVVDGPFSNITADYYDVKYKPHCLSRGFRDKAGNLGHIDGEDISLESIYEVLATERYEDFVASMESRVHDAIPFGIGGDFETFTAPYDPIFYLHHTQLDRLWWLWQRKSDRHKNEYGGHKHRHSIEMASLSDEIEMQGLAASVTVDQVMNTEGELLCYTY